MQNNENMDEEGDEDLLPPQITPFEESPLELVCPHCDSKVFTAVTVSFRRFGFCIGHCCVVPCCVSIRYEHSCPRCTRTIGVGTCDD